MVTQVTKPKNTLKHILDAEHLSALNARSNWLGLSQLAGHLSIMALSGYLWLTTEPWWLKAIALVIYGFSLAAMFAPLHECSHRTAFANNRLNTVVAWLAGLLSFYNSAFYRRYHKWHHRYTQVAGKDPELDDPKPSNLWEYIVEISGFNWWVGKFKGHYRVATRNFQGCPFISESAQAAVTRSMRLQLAVYLGAIALSTALGHPWLVVYAWLLPLAVGQPILRWILLAEHTNCTQDNNFLTNTRTTLTRFPLRFMVWNIPFHAEHHLYASIPFHKLPQAHQQLRQHFANVEPGYIKVHQDIVAGWE